MVEYIRQVFLPAGKYYFDNSKRRNDVLILVFREWFSLWFYWEDDRWKWDGWETGDYRDRWLGNTLNKELSK